MPVAKASTEVFTLNDGTKIPAVGLGTWQSTDNEAYEAVLFALKNGYRHIDTAAAYGNEEQVGKAIKDSGVPRSEIYVTTKLWGTFHQDPETAIKSSLEKLGLEYIDLYLIHWPVELNPHGNDPKFPSLPNGKRDIIADSDYTKTYARVQELVTKGYTKSVGVSNISVENLTKLLAAPTTKIVPAVNQVELHPYLPQHKLLELTKSKGIYLEAYSPLGSTESPLFKDETIVKIAKKNDVSPATILISWAVQRGTVVLPKSITPSRIEDNLKTIKLSEEDFEEINNLHKVVGVKRFINPDWSPITVFHSDD
ncbi:Aldo/keto reductase [Scheffersomyces amazonensis]|uniref:Aldo/keto reductase n=1 Tax=Scheffersomyces amazonensis TaxID=1078765 RepID=UPI00315D979D